ncbi:hypothetical protein BRO54_2943 [Geobacillus proteiniphilus]|uniref:Uncharacterized protein n=1 Tax=Geobacillus proteiniphilus TaxID=860353 RepID=A0A1Q5SS22_9BACL|nr:hypothetical protein BRO54_2943 [Geobacillus proteiniphilus]
MARNGRRLMENLSLGGWTGVNAKASAGTMQENGGKGG